MNRNAETGFFTAREETFNAITHGIGALLSPAAFATLVAIAAMQDNRLGVLTFSVYGTTLVLLYVSSYLYHRETDHRRKKVLRTLDHMSVYTLIAGSYTPIALLVLKGVWGWVLLAAVWLLALVGIALAMGKSARVKGMSMALYFLMGWLVVVAAKPMLDAAPAGLIILVLVGGLFYTGGIVFYAVQKIPHHHGIWHLFVLAGSIAHFLGCLIYMT